MNDTDIEVRTMELRKRFREYANELHETERRSRYLRNALRGLDQQITRYSIRIEELRSMIAVGDLSYLEDETCVK